MVITNRELAVGTKLSVRYKKELYTAEVVAGAEGVLFRLADGREFKSPSGAGAAVKGGGKTCDGWKFWSLAEDGATATAEAPTEATQEVTEATSAKAAKPRRTATTKQVRKVPNQKGVPEGQARWFCSACMAGFFHDLGSEPGTCPQGHPREIADEFAGMPSTDD